ncbi:MAG TPA: hypothetical protein VFH11_11755 [Gemmatimonadota bacterium]|nr:hypothetical protein [Gemmatimonadota bacterium]
MIDWNHAHLPENPIPFYRAPTDAEWIDPAMLIVLLRYYPDGGETLIAITDNDPQALMHCADCLETGHRFPTREEGAVIWRVRRTESEYLWGETPHGEWNYRMCDFASRRDEKPGNKLFLALLSVSDHKVGDLPE